MFDCSEPDIRSEVETDLLRKCSCGNAIRVPLPPPVFLSTFRALVECTVPCADGDVLQCGVARNQEMFEVHVTRAKRQWSAWYF
jgi:hypothetical protein